MLGLLCQGFFLMQRGFMSRSFHLTRFCFLAGLVFAGLYPTAAVAVPVCTTGSLASYVSLDSGGGCTIGDYTFLRFSDPTPSTKGSPTVASPWEITVTPILTATGAGFSFTASEDSTNLFAISSASGTTAVTYYIDYSVDPAPIVGTADLSIDPPHGNVAVTQMYCAADVLATGCRLGVKSQQTVTVSSPVSVITFPSPQSFVDIDTDICLSATPGDPASIDAIDSFVNTPASAVPEPATLPLTAGLFTLLFLVRRKRA
jgi:hypothetical protein